MVKLTSLIALVAGLTTGGVARAATLEIDPARSSVEVAVRCTVDSFVARLTKWQITVDCDPASARPVRADASFDFGDLKTGNLSRDSAMLKWLQYDLNPKVEFHLTGWKETPGGSVALGELTMHGVTMPVQMSAVATHGGADWDIHGQAELDYRDFKLTKIRKALVLTVDPKLTVKIHLIGKTVAAK